jgi:hypothetical protein
VEAAAGDRRPVQALTEQGGPGSPSMIRAIANRSS